MEKFNSFLENPYYRAILWLALGVIIFLVGITRPKADVLDSFIVPSGAQFYDNSNGTLSAVTTDYVNNSGDSFHMSYSIHTIPNSSGAAIAFNLSEPLISGYVYTISVSVGPIGCGETRLSSLNRLGLGGSYNSAKTNYQNGGNASIRFSDYQVSGQGYKGLSYAFVPSTNATYIVIPYTTANNCTDVNYFYGYTINNLGTASSVTQTDINNSINNQTTIINNAISNSETNITNAITQSQNVTDSTIVNNANSTNDVINNGLQTCTKQFKFTLKKGKAFKSNGTLSDNPDSYYTEKYYSLSGATKLTISNTGLSYPDYSGYIIIYDSSKNFLDYWSVKDVTFNLPSGASYYRLSTQMTGLTLYEGDGCTSKLDAVNDTLTDDNVDGNSSSSFFEDFTVTDNGGISSIITAPLVAINSMLSNQCSSLSGTWRGQTFELPCGTDFWNRMSTIRTWLNVAIGGLLCYRIIIKLFKLIEGFKNPDNDRVEVMNL